MDGLSHFCVMCFADEASGSWNHTTIPESNYCTNCSSGGTLVKIPRWAVESIRKSASWVGKRYYPNEEDTEATEERNDLLVFVEAFHGRTAEPALTLEGHWNVSQPRPQGGSISTLVKADSADEAIEATRYRLRYYAPERFIFGKVPE